MMCFNLIPNPLVGNAPPDRLAEVSSKWIYPNMR